MVPSGVVAWLAEGDRGTYSTLTPPGSSDVVAWLAEGDRGTYSTLTPLEW